jgi:ABC-type antimicrobial peptide transport system permease subunit
MDIIVRTQSAPSLLAASIRDAVRQADSRVAVTAVDVVESLIRRSFAEERLRTALITLFGSMAAVLAAVGMYGVTARAVSRRTREVGIRVALGATVRGVMGLILRHTLSSVAAGIVIGVALAAALTRLLEPYLFGISVSDPITYAGILVFLGVISLGATWVPARRAGRIEPASVLRGE